MCMWSAALIGVGLKHLALQPWYFAACGQWSQKSKCSVAQSMLSAPRFSLMRLPLNGDPFPAALVQGACKGNHTMRHHCQHVPSILLQGLLFVMCVGWDEKVTAIDSLPTCPQRSLWRRSIAKVVLVAISGGNLPQQSPKSSHAPRMVHLRQRPMSLPGES